MGIIIRFVNREQPEESTNIALEQVKESFMRQGVTAEILFSPQEAPADFFIGTLNESPLLQKLAAQKRIDLLPGKESLTIQELAVNDNGPPAVVVCAADTRGLNYALYELAERIDSQPLNELTTPVTEKPFLPIREVFTFHNFRRPQQTFFTPAYWDPYFSLLVRTRFNRFRLLLTAAEKFPGLPFPYFLDAPEFPEIRAVDAPPAVKEKNLLFLQNVSRAARRHGIDFILGLEQALPAADLPFPPFPVTGLAQGKIIPYTYAVLKELLTLCPELDGIFLRWKGASTIPVEQQIDFLLETYIRVLKENPRKAGLILDAEGLAQETVAALRREEVPLALSGKYQGVFFTLPCYPVKTPAEAGYDGFDPEDAPLPLIHELWTASHRVLLWGDPELARRFVLTFPANGPRGCAVAPPLAWKDAGYDRRDWPLLRYGQTYYTWEYERYWYFYLLFGRLCYNPYTSGKVWLREFNRRFGAAGVDLAELYSIAGKIITLYVTAHAGAGRSLLWPEIDTGGLLDYYLQAPPGVPEFFSSITQYVRDFLDGKTGSRITPEDVAQYLDELGENLLEKITLCRGNKPSPRYLTRREVAQGEICEDDSTRRDFMVLANFARYHAVKIRSALALAFFYETGDWTQLLLARDLLREAGKFWREIIRTTSNLYFHRMVTGPGEAGHWRDKLLFLLEEERRINAVIREHQQQGLFLLGFDFGSSLLGAGGTGDRSVEKRFYFAGPQTEYNIEEGFGWLETTDLHGVSPPPARLSEKDLVTGTATCSYGLQLFNDLVWGRKPAVFRVDLLPGTYQVRLSLCDQTSRPLIRGPLSIKLNGTVITENLVVPAGKRVDLVEIITIKEGEHLAVEFSSRQGADWFISALTIRPVAPLIAHSPAVLKPGFSQVFQATVTGVNPVTGVILHYQAAAADGYAQTPMRPAGNGLYRCELPPPATADGKITAYYITAFDNEGGEAACGGPEAPLTPRWQRPVRQIPYLIHHPPEKISPQPGSAYGAQPITVTSRNPGEIKEISLCYRLLREKKATVLPMAFDGEKFTAEIPGSSFRRGQRLVYYFQVITAGNDGFILPDPLHCLPFYMVEIE